MGPLERKIIAFFIIHVFTFPDKHNGKIYIYPWTNCKALRSIKAKLRDLSLVQTKRWLQVLLSSVAINHFSYNVAMFHFLVKTKKKAFSGVTNCR